MHEFAITRSLLQQILDEARRQGAKRVCQVNLVVGERASVVPECVRFYFEELRKGTVAEGAELHFRTEPLRIRCPKCGSEFSSIAEMCSCNAGGEVVSGEELVIESIELE
ncbi:MAG: hydrogenase maturation nickel metallochaperone HypA [candidate division WOR-3 bacterium]